MIHVLAVDPEDARDLGAPPSFEVVWAHSADDAVEKLARNRRLDAVVFFEDRVARETAAVLAREALGAPPMFRSGSCRLEAAQPLDSDDLFGGLARRLGE